jgi:RHS repeat-associated protein
VTSFQYGPEGDRFIRNDNQGQSVTYYIGNVEIVLANGTPTLVRRDLGVAIDLIDPTGVNNDRRYTFSDHLGSVDAIAHADGSRVEAGSFDAWGNRRNPDTWAQAGATAPLSTTNRGFTGHERLDNFGFIHMNGRIYDPQLGKMLQADPIQNPGSQGLNRYSYVANNPLTLTDPSGYSWMSWLRVIAAVAITVFAPELWGVAQLQLGFWQTVATGFIAGVVSTGSLQGGLVGAFSAGLFYGIGSAFSQGNAPNLYDHGELTSMGEAGKVLAHGVAGGVMSSLQGGKFGSGFLSAGVAEAASGQIQGIKVAAGRVIAASIVGGTTSVLAGGKFANGAVTGAFSQAFNEEQHSSQTVKGYLPTDIQVLGDTSSYSDDQIDSLKFKMAHDLNVYGNMLSTSGDSEMIDIFNRATVSIDFDDWSTKYLGDIRQGAGAFVVRGTDDIIFNVNRFFCGPALPIGSIPLYQYPS